MTVRGIFSGDLTKTRLDFWKSQGCDGLAGGSSSENRRKKKLLLNALPDLDDGKFILSMPASTCFTYIKKKKKRKKLTLLITNA